MFASRLTSPLLRSSLILLSAPSRHVRLFSSRERDPFDVLGVSRGANDKQIKDAYRQFTKTAHPDLFNNADEATKKSKQEQFAEINKAYDRIKTQEDRDRYDLHGGDDDYGFDMEGSDIDMEDLEFAFGGQRGGRRSKSRRGVSQTLVKLTFRESMSGATRPVSIDCEVNCSSCSGTGSHKGRSDFRICEKCSGSGVSRSGHKKKTKCTRCKGQGRVPSRRCSECKDGKTRGTSHVQIQIPAGAKHGSVLQLRLNDRLTQTIRVRIEVQPDETFCRIGDDIHVYVPITLAQAALEETIAVPTPEGNRKLRIKPGTVNGDSIRYANGGFYSRDNHQRGDFVVNLEVIAPTTLSDRRRQLLQQLRQLEILEEGQSVRLAPSSRPRSKVVSELKIAKEQQSSSHAEDDDDGFGFEDGEEMDFHTFRKMFGNMF